MLPAILELQTRPQWVAWGEFVTDKKAKKPKKVPINPATGRAAKADTPTTWDIYDRAIKRAARQSLKGVGFVFSDDDPYAGIDLDGCVAPDGTIAEWAWEIIRVADSYTEYSPSRTGVKIFGYGHTAQALKQAPVEVYSTRRFFTVTGKHVPGTPTELRTIQPAIDDLIARYRPAPTPQLLVAPVGGQMVDDARLRTWAANQLDRVCAEMRHAPDGDLHNTRVSKGHYLGGICAHGLIDPNTAADQLYDARTPQENHASERKSIEQAIVKGMGNPISLPTFTATEPTWNSDGRPCCPEHGTPLVRCRNGNGWRCADQFCIPLPNGGRRRFWWNGEGYDSEQAADRRRKDAQRKQAERRTQAQERQQAAEAFMDAVTTIAKDDKRLHRDECADMALDYCARVGWSRAYHRIPLHRIAEQTGYSERNIQRAMHRLIDYGYFVQTEVPGYTSVWSFANPMTGEVFHTAALSVDGPGNDIDVIPHIDKEPARARSKPSVDPVVSSTPDALPEPLPVEVFDWPDEAPVAGSSEVSSMPAWLTDDDGWLTSPKQDKPNDHGLHVDPVGGQESPNRPPTQQEPHNPPAPVHLAILGSGQDAPHAEAYDGGASYTPADDWTLQGPPTKRPRPCADAKAAYTMSRPAGSLTYSALDGEVVLAPVRDAGEPLVQAIPLDPQKRGRYFALLGKAKRCQGKQAYALRQQAKELMDWVPASEAEARRAEPVQVPQRKSRAEERAALWDWLDVAAPSIASDARASPDAVTLPDPGKVLAFAPPTPPVPEVSTAAGLIANLYRRLGRHADADAIAAEQRQGAA